MGLVGHLRCLGREERFRYLLGVPKEVHSPNIQQDFDLMIFLSVEVLVVGVLNERNELMLFCNC